MCQLQCAKAATARLGRHQSTTDGHHGQLVSHVFVMCFILFMTEMCTQFGTPAALHLLNGPLGHSGQHLFAPSVIQCFQGIQASTDHWDLWLDHGTSNKSQLTKPNWAQIQLR